MTNTPPTDQQLDEIEGRILIRRTALSGWINYYSPVSEQEALEGAEAVLNDDVPVLVAEVRRQRAELDAEKAQHQFTLRQRNNRSTRLLHLRDLANAGDAEALLAAAKDTLAASVHDHDACGQQPDSEETPLVACEATTTPIDRQALAGLMAFHTAKLAATFRLYLSNELSEHRAGMERAVGLLDLHKEQLLGGRWTDDVRRMLTAMVGALADEGAASMRRDGFGLDEIADMLDGPVVPAGTGE